MRVCRYLTTFTTALLLCWGGEAAAAITAVLADGTVKQGRHWHGLNDQSGQVRLDGKEPGSEKNPLISLVDHQLSPRLSGPFVELAGGDILPGEVAKAVLDGLDAPPHLVIATGGTNGSLRVRLAAVRGIHAGVGSSSRGDNTAELLDGQTIAFRALKWRADGVELLTDSGVSQVGFRELRRLVLGTDQPSPPLPGLAWFTPPGDRAVRVALADGGVFTVPVTMFSDDIGPAFRRELGLSAKFERGMLTVTRPAWSLDPLLFAPEDVAAVTWLNLGEFPLSLLPAEGLPRGQQIQSTPWRVNRNCRGQQLHTGDLGAEPGVGMHGSSAVRFTLPAGAATFRTWVGIDRASGNGGCVRCAVYRDEVVGEPFWQSGFLQGRDKPARVGPLDVRGAKHLVLVVDAAHEGRPEGADPFDIRDDVDWILPTITVESQSFRQDTDLAAWAPTLEGWSIPDEIRKQVSLRPFWHQKTGDFFVALVGDETPIVLQREVTIKLTNAWLPLRAGRDDSGGSAHHLVVSADGEEVPSTMNGNLRTYSLGSKAERFYSLAHLAGEKIDLRVEAKRVHKNKSFDAGLILESIALEPLVTGLPPSGSPWEPDVPLESLEPVPPKVRRKRVDLKPGRCSNGDQLNIRNWRFDTGYGVPTGSSITYELNPKWRRFVAVLGLTEGWKGVGYSIALDDEVIWASDQEFGRNQPGEQLDLPIPAGHKTITLKVLGDESHGAWAQAGFLVEQE